MTFKIRLLSSSWWETGKDEQNDHADLQQVFRHRRRERFLSEHTHATRECLIAVGFS
jgi:hypothetical protein